MRHDWVMCDWLVADDDECDAQAHHVFIVHENNEMDVYMSCVDHMSTYRAWFERRKVMILRSAHSREGLTITP